MKKQRKMRLKSSYTIQDGSYVHCGSMEFDCGYCYAFHWLLERKISAGYTMKSPKFHTCPIYSFPGPRLFSLFVSTPFRKHPDRTTRPTPVARWPCRPPPMHRRHRLCSGSRVSTYSELATLTAIGLLRERTVARQQPGLHASSTPRLHGFPCGATPPPTVPPVVLTCRPMSSTLLPHSLPTYRDASRPI